MCDGHYAHVVDEVLDTCEALGILVVLLPPHCAHLSQGEDIYHFGVFEGSYRAEYITNLLSARWIFALDASLSVGQVITKASLLGIPCFAFAGKPTSTFTE